MTYDLYPLSLSLKLCEPFDSIDTRYLNQIYSPLVNPFKNALDIKLYNEKWFNKSLLTSNPKMVYDHDTLKLLDEYFPPFPFVSELHKETDTCPP